MKPEGCNEVEVVDTLIVNDLARAKAELTCLQREDAEDGFFVCDLGDVVQKHVKWQRIFPNIQPFYAIKCNPSEVLLRTMVAMGTGFDCASKAEIGKMLKLGTSPDKIIFANPCKQSSHIRFARDNGVKLMVFDNEIELYKIKKICPDAKLVLRIQTDDSASICRFSMKFGAHPDSCEMLVKTAKMLELDMVGVSFHVGSGCQDVNAYVKALQLARSIFDFATARGFDMTLLDIGGGFPGSEGATLTVDKIAEVVNASVDDLFHSTFENLHVIAEPGRYYAASAFTLFTNVIAKRKVISDKITCQDDLPIKDAILKAVNSSVAEEPSYMYFLNDGLYGSFNCLFYDHAEVKPVLLKNYGKLPEEFTSSIWGPTCDGLDKIIDSCSLPELETGDWIVWNDMGAYTIAAGSAFNGFKTSTVYYTISSTQLKVLSKLCLNEVASVSFVLSDSKGSTVKKFGSNSVSSLEDIDV